MYRPSGEGRGSTTGPAAGTENGTPPSVRTAHRAPDSANATRRAASSVAYDTTPTDRSRARSRSSRSSSGTAPGPAPTRRAGSANSRSAPSSYCHSRPTGSVPETVRTKSTRRPSGETVKCLGTPREKRRLRANWRGKSAEFVESVEFVESGELGVCAEVTVLRCKMLSSKVLSSRMLRVPVGSGPGTAIPGAT